jgi:hypothetical protein
MFFADKDNPETSMLNNNCVHSRNCFGIPAIHLIPAKTKSNAAVLLAHATPITYQRRSP